MNFELFLKWHSMNKNITFRFCVLPVWVVCLRKFTHKMCKLFEFFLHFRIVEMNNDDNQVKWSSHATFQLNVVWKPLAIAFNLYIKLEVTPRVPKISYDSPRHLGRKRRNWTGTRYAWRAASLTDTLARLWNENATIKCKIICMKLSSSWHCDTINMHRR